MNFQPHPSSLTVFGVYRTYPPTQGTVAIWMGGGATPREFSKRAAHFYGPLRAFSKRDL